MTRQRKYIPMAERLAAALAEQLPQDLRDELRASKVPAWAVLRLFTPDHNILHAHDGPDKWWNLTMRRRGPELKAKDKADTKIAAKDKRLRGETGTAPRRKIPSRPFQAQGKQNEQR